MYEDFHVTDRWTGEDLHCQWKANIVAIATRHADAVDDHLPSSMNWTPQGHGWHAICMRSPMHVRGIARLPTDRGTGHVGT